MRNVSPSACTITGVPEFEAVLGPEAAEPAFEVLAEACMSTER